MVKIRLTRTGKKHEPHYRIVAVHDRSKRDGKYIEKIGYYDPKTVPPTISYDKDILKKWIDRGAQMTDTVYDAFVREGIIKPSKKRKFRISLKIAASQKRKEDTQKDEQETNKETPVKKEGNNKAKALDKATDIGEKPTPAPDVKQPAQKPEKESVNIKEK